MRGRTGQSGGGNELGQGQGSGFEGTQHDRGLVQNAYSASIVHELILASQSLRRKVKSSLFARTSKLCPPEMQVRQDLIRATSRRSWSWQALWPRRYGKRTWCVGPRASPISSTSTSTCCMR